MRSMIPPSGELLHSGLSRQMLIYFSFVLRDDPSLDESTRLRNRIAELESLVRELRGTSKLPTTKIFHLTDPFSIFPVLLFFFFLLHLQASHIPGGQRVVSVTEIRTKNGIHAPRNAFHYKNASNNHRKMERNQPVGRVTTCCFATVVLCTRC
jgi:hypothetical protein